MLILFVLIGFGAVARKTKLVPESSIDGIVNLLILVVTPCLIIDAFQRPFESGMLSGLGITFVLAFFGHLATIVAAYLLVRHHDENVRRPLQLSAVFSNAGFMGIPLEQALLGNSGVFYGIIYIVVFNLFIWSWGYGVMSNSPRRGFNLKMVVNPGTVGLLVGLPLFFFSWRLPDVVFVPVHQMANLNTPLAMVVIGYCLAGARLGRVVKMGAVYMSIFIRLIAYPLAIIAVMYPFRHQLDRNMMLAVTIAASAPVAAMVSMFASKFHRDVDVSVAMVSGTTLLSVITMPIVIALAMTVL